MEIHSAKLIILSMNTSERDIKIGAYFDSIIISNPQNVTFYVRNMGMIKAGT